MEMKKVSIRLVILIMMMNPAVMTAQDTDTLNVVDLEEMVITADRYESIRSQSTGAISVLRGATISQMAGVQRLGGLLQQVPGFVMLQLDGIGYDVQPIVRGFYGGGEAEYVLLMVDGQPVNALETGLVNWDQIPLAAIESVEILRGGASSLYGDAAIGGVINIVTDTDAPPSYEFTVAGGSFGSFKSSGSARFSLGSRKITSYGNFESTHGYRDHADRTLAGLGLGVDLLRSEQGVVTLNGSMHMRSFDVPGPLTMDQIAQDPLQASPFFRFDNQDERTLRLALRGKVILAGESELRASVIGNLRSLEGARTLPLTAEFADVKWREFDTSRLFLSAQWMTPSVFANDQLIIGTDLHRGQLAVAWYDMVTGAAEEFDNFDGSVGELSTSGDGSRNTVAAYMQYDIEPIPRVRASMGMRYDRIHDKHEPSQTPEQDATHSALSPKFGVNIRYMSSARHVGNWYANITRSFKTATLDQLFGQRLIPIPTPPFAISLSNSELKPQRGISFETGVYHRMSIVPGSLTGELTLSVYQMDMEDELDFQLETFQYGNIASSRHRGVEMGLAIKRLDIAALRFNYTLQDVTYQAGEYEGNFIKAIPRNYVSATVSVPILDRIQAMATVRSTHRTWLDDENTVELDNFSSVDFKLVYQLGWMAVEFETINLRDNLFSTTGFLLANNLSGSTGSPDSDESGTVFMYPAAGRAFQVGLRVKW